MAHENKYAKMLKTLTLIMQVCRTTIFCGMYMCGYVVQLYVSKELLFVQQIKSVLAFFYEMKKNIDQLFYFYRQGIPSNIRTRTAQKLFVPIHSYTIGKPQLNSFVTS